MEIFTSRAALALLISVAGGAVLTFAWSEVSHRLNRKNYTEPEQLIRHRTLSFIFGVLQRALLTTFAIWIPMAVGPFAGTWLVAKSIVNWAGMDAKSHAGRARFSVALFGSLVSILWAVAWGIWGNSALHLCAASH